MRRLSVRSLPCRSANGAEHNWLRVQPFWGPLMQHPTQCPNCSALCMDTDSHCQHCRSSLKIGWIRWLPGITSAVFALLMAAALVFGIPAAQWARADTATAIALNMTTTLFICASATFGAFLGWVVAWLIKSVAKG
jgi:hypothetical protein